MEIQLTNYFYQLYNCKSKIILQQGGSSSGKSYTTIQVLLFKLIQEKNIVITCCCSTYPQIWRGIFRDCCDIINKIPILKKFIGDCNKNGCKCETTNSVLEFSAYPTRESAKSGKRDYLFCDEITNLDEEIFFELEMRTKKQTFCAWNPNSKFWIHKLYEGNKECKWFFTTYKANPFCDEKIKKQLEDLKFIDENKYKVYCLGICGANEGTIFNDWSLIDDEDFPQEYKWRGIGVDFGFKDPTAIVDLRYSNGCYYIKELKYEGLDNLEIDEFLKSLKLKKDIRVICDSAEPRAIQELKKLSKGQYSVEGAMKGNDSIRIGLDAMKRNHIYITKSSNNLQTEFLRYSYKQDSLGNYTNEPKGGFDHLIDSSRYVILNLVVGGDRNKKSKITRYA